jgi:hypothetical protein
VSTYSQKSNPCWFGISIVPFRIGLLRGYEVSTRISVLHLGQRIVLGTLNASTRLLKTLLGNSVSSMIPLPASSCYIIWIVKLEVSKVKIVPLNEQLLGADKESQSLLYQKLF